MKIRIFSETVPFIYLNSLKALDNMGFLPQTSDYVKGKITAVKYNKEPAFTNNLEISITKLISGKNKITVVSRITKIKKRNTEINREIEKEFFTTLISLFYKKYK